MPLIPSGKAGQPLKGAGSAHEAALGFAPGPELKGVEDGENNTASKILRPGREISGNFKIYRASVWWCWWAIEEVVRPLPTERESGALELELSVAVRHLLGHWELSLGPLQKHKCSDPLDHLSGPRNHILKQNIQTQEELPGCACAWLRAGTGPVFTLLI